MQNIDPIQVIVFLNSLLKIDSEAINKLMFYRVPCNEKLANHNTVQVKIDEQSNASVGLLGLLNGLCGINEDGWGFIVAEINEMNNKIERFIHIKDRK